MNTLLQNWRPLVLAPFLVFVLARLVFLGEMGWYGRSSATLQIPAQTPSPSIRKTIALPVVASAEPLGEVTMLKLDSILRDYIYTLNGQLVCGEGSPCERDVRIVVDSDHNPNIVLKTRSTPDGRFHARVDIREFDHRPLDWRAELEIPDSPIIEMHGRVILAEDLNIQVDRTLTLP